MTRLVARLWPVRWVLLTAVLAGGYLLVGVASPLPLVRWPALAGGVMVLAALWLAGRSPVAAWTLLITGAALPAITAWWSLVLPFAALIMLVSGSLAVRAAAGPVAQTTDWDVRHCPPGRLVRSLEVHREGET